ncbi:hypothetical protein MMC17_001368 [Xylographa soralifera]|nr:hypothetical protein [Xylographa soralifera]
MAPKPAEILETWRPSNSGDPLAAEQDIFGNMLAIEGSNDEHQGSIVCSEELFVAQESSIFRVPLGTVSLVKIPRAQTATPLLSARNNSKPSCMAAKFDYLTRILGMSLAEALLFFGSHDMPENPTHKLLEQIFGSHSGDCDHYENPRQGLSTRYSVFEIEIASNVITAAKGTFLKEMLDGEVRSGLDILRMETGTFRKYYTREESKWLPLHPNHQRAGNAVSTAKSVGGLAVPTKTFTMRWTGPTFNFRSASTLASR